MDEGMWRVLREHTFQFDADITIYLRCEICKLVLVKPVQVRGCGCRYCERCLQQAVEEANGDGFRCVSLGCNELVTDVSNDAHPDIDTEQSIRMLKVACPSCRSQTALAQIPGHLQICNGQTPFEREHGDNQNRPAQGHEMAGATWPGHRDEVASLRDRLAEMEARMGSLGSKIEIMEATVSRQNVKLQSMDDELEQSRTAEPRNCGIVLSITQFGTMKRGECVWSDPFYAWREGYRVRLRVHPHGDYQCPETDVAIYLQILSGRWDALLPWPACLTLSVSLLSQNLSQNRKSLSRSTSIQCTSRPTPDCKSPSSGWSCFVTWDELTTSWEHTLPSPQQPEPVFLRVVVQPTSAADPPLSSR